MIQKHTQYKENITSLYPERKAQDKSRKIRAKSLQFLPKLKQMAIKHKTLTHCTPNKATPPFHFYNANYLYLMRIAIIKENRKKQHHFKSYIMKKTYQIKTLELVPIFNTR
jgi:hypothetical protein